MARLGLDPAPAIPLAGVVSRLAAQKGFELMYETLPKILAQRALNFVVLGSGEAQYEEFFAGLARQFPQRVHFHRGYDDELAHWIEAASDMFLMPSRYEPCGLNQMYSLRYGTVPVVRRTGGLADSVQHFNPADGTGTGVVFNDFDAPALEWATEHRARPVRAAASLGAAGAQRHGVRFFLAARRRRPTSRSTTGSSAA